MITVIENMAEWCAREPRFSATAHRLAKEAISDTLGCLYAGREGISALAVRQAWSGYQTPPAAIVALINATSAPRH